MMRMAEAEGTGNVGGEDAEGQRRGFAGGWFEALVIGDVVGNVMSACGHQQVVEAKAPGFGDAPGRDPFAAHAVLVMGRFFQ